MSILLVALLALCQLASAEQLLAGAPWRTHSCVQRRDSSRRSVAVVQEMLDVQGDYRNSIQALHSAFQVADGERFPGSPHSKDAPVVFLISEETLVPPIALALRGAGKAAIVAEGKARLDQNLKPYKVDLPGGVRVVARLGELIYEDGSGVSDPDAVAAAPEEAKRLALSLAKKPIHAAVRKQLPAIGSQVSPHGIGPQDAGHRVLA